MCQGRCRHIVVTCSCTSLHLNSERALWHGVAQVCNKRRPLGHASRAQGLGRDKAGPRQGPHARVTGTQVGALAVVQGGQGSRQAHLLARYQALH
jgi:hypothetical protein